MLCIVGQVQHARAGELPQEQQRTSAGHRLEHKRSHTHRPRILPCPEALRLRADGRSNSNQAQGEWIWEEPVSVVVGFGLVPDTDTFNFNGIWICQ